MVARFNDSFEVTWHDPEDAGYIWAIDRIHFSHPLAPLGEDFYSVVVGVAWGARTAFANGYLFIKDFKPPSTPDEVRERGAKQIWDEKYAPLVRQLCSEVRAPDYEGMSAAEIVGMLPDVFQMAAEAFSYPTVISSTFMAPAMQLTTFCEQQLGEEGPILATTLLQGFDNESLAAGSGLEELAALASGHEELRRAICRRDYEGLAQLPGGREFTGKLQSYLDAYGWRAGEWCLLHLPTWAEDPSIPLDLVARYMQDPEHAPSRAHERAMRAREEAATEIQRRLSPQQLAEFQDRLEAALTHVPVSEERALWQLIAVGSARVPLLALGRKLAEAGVIEQPDNIFYLRLAELQELAVRPCPARETVRQRKSEHSRYCYLQPPQSIGAPFVVEDRPAASQLVHRYFFGTVPASYADGVMRGLAASQGVVTARARIVHSLNEAARLQQGEILVCRTTAPPWTPLFALAAGVITEIGGILSHSAICAREYAIPCVVGTQVATSSIPDGAIVTVDGTRGTVTIEA